MLSIVLLPEDRDGGGDESTGNHIASHGEVDPVLASGRNHRVSDRHMRRWRERDEEFGERELFDGRRGKPSPKRVAAAVVERCSSCKSTTKRGAHHKRRLRRTLPDMLLHIEAAIIAGFRIGK